MQDKINANGRDEMSNAPQPKKKEPQKLFPIRYAKYKSFYLLVVLASAVALGVGIYVSVSEDLFWGAIILFSAVLIYVSFTASELHEKLGIWYRTESGALFVTKCRARYGDVFYIPSRLLWYDVEELCDNAFSSPANKNAELRAVFLPKTLKRIGKNVFNSCSSLRTIYFSGTEEEWAKIEKGTNFESFEVVFNILPPTNKK